VIEKKKSPAATGPRFPESKFNTTSIAETFEFLKSLFPVDVLWDLQKETKVPLLIEFRALKNNERTRIKAFPVSELSESSVEEILYNNRGRNLIFGVGSRNKVGGKDTVYYINALWLDIDPNKTEQDVDAKQKVVDSLLTFNPEPTYIIDSGHGTHAYWILKEPIQKKDFEIIEKLNFVLKDEFNGDQGVCHCATMMRLPGSINFKSKPAPVIVLCNSRKKYSLEEIINILAAKIPSEKKLPLDYKREEPVQPGSFSPGIINKTIEKCLFLRYCRDEAITLEEPYWYMMISNLAALGATKKIHELSSPYPKYSKNETERKIEHALKASGPHTCKYISESFDDCKNCRWNGKFKSPSSIAYSISSGRCYTPLFGDSEFHKTEQYLLSSDLELWKKVLEIAGVQLDITRLQEDKSVKLPDIFGSGNPSKIVYSLFHPGTLYTDFSGKSNFQLHCFANKMNYDIIEVFLALKDGGNPRKAKMNSKELSRFYSWIEEEGITTLYGVAFDEWWNRLKPELEKQFDLMARVLNNKFLDEIHKASAVIISEARRNYNNGKEWFMCSVRHLIKKMDTNISLARANRAMNFLVLSGLLKKGEFTRVNGRETYKYSLDFLTLPEDIFKTWKELGKEGIASVNRFTRDNIALIFGEEKAAETFRILQR
jgi:hypothetical protein